MTLLTDIHARRPVAFRRSALLLIAAGLAVAAGCDRDEGSASVRRASTGLHTITGGATTVTPAGVREKTYNDVVNEAKAGIDAGAVSQNAALLVTAQAQLGQADEPMSQYAAAEREALNRVTVIRSLLAAYVEHSAMAAAARQYDPAQDLAAIEQGIAGKAKEIAAQDKVRADVDARVQALRADAKTELDAAAALDAEAAQLRDQASKVSAVQGEPLVKQAAEKRRAADARRMKGLQIQAQIDVTVPQSEEAKLVAEQFAKQKEDLEATRQELMDRDRAAKEQAAAATAEAARTAQRLASELDELAKLRDGGMAQAAEQSQSRLNAAKASAQKAANAPGAKALLGDINQALAELAWQRAFGFSTHAQLLESIAATSPAVPEQARLADAAKASREGEKKSLEEAKEAFDAAKSAYEGAGARGEAKERLERLGELLDKSAKRAGGDKLDLLGAFAVRKRKADAEEAAPADAAPAAGMDPDLRATIESMLAAISQDQLDPYFEHFDTSTPEAQQLLASTRGMAKLEAACKAKFGESIMASLAQMGGMGGAADAGLAEFERIKALSVDDFTAEVNGDTATATAPGLPQPWRFVRKDGRWMVEVEVPAEVAQNPMAQQAMKLMGVMGPVFEELTAEVESGRLGSIQAVTTAMTQKMMANPEFQQIMRQMQGGGGGQ